MVFNPHSQTQAFTWFNVVVTSLDRALVCEHSNLSCQAVLSCLFLLILHIEIQRFLLNFDLALLGVKGLITVK